MDPWVEQRVAGVMVAGRLTQVMRQRDLLLLEAAELAAELDDLKFAGRESGLTTIDWIRRECRVGYGTAADLVRVGQEMR